MPSLRTRLTTRYAAAILAATLAFVGAVYLSLRSVTERDLEARAQIRADAAWKLLRRSLLSGGMTITGDSSTGTQQIAIATGTRDLMDVLTGPYLILNGRGLVYASPNVRTFWERGDSLLSVALDALKRGQRSATWSRDATEYLFVHRIVHDPAFGDLDIVGGADASPIDEVPLEVIGEAMIVFPILFGLSLAGGYLISGRATRALASVDRITTEVTALTDGRSLHRRLPVDASSEEMARLTTQLNSMIERLEKSFGGLRRFTADASHELKTPLTVLRADVERAMHAPPQSTEQLVALEEALQETTRMGDLVESLLTLARADEGRFDLLREPVALEPLAYDVFETATILGEAAGLRVTMPVAQPAIVLGDHKRLRQLFLNLVTNALKYTSRGGEVELTLTRTDTDAIFSVRDTGIGISAADLPHVFERFWRADRSRSRVGERGGVGLGLAIGQWIAQAHGGTLTVQSRLHRGSTFTVNLPITTQEANRAADEVGTVADEYRAAS
jgi:signal transduction histidine kinase